MTLDEAKQRLAMWMEAEEAIAVAGQSYKTQGGRELTRANIAEVRRYIIFYERKIAVLSGRGRRTYGVIPRDL